MESNRSDRPGRFGSTDPKPQDPPDPPTPGSPGGPNMPADPGVPTTPATPPRDPALPPSTQPASPATAQSAMDDLTAQVAASVTIEDSAVALIRGVAAQMVAAAPGNAAIAQLSAKLHASAQALGQSITDSTPFAAAPVTVTQQQMGGVKSKR